VVSNNAAAIMHLPVSIVGARERAKASRNEDDVIDT
jgi:hypothetical protein